MALDLSFPNCICLLLLGFLFINLMAREKTVVSQPKSSEDLKQIFCRLPQSFNRVDLKVCTSTEKLFKLLRNDCSSRRRESEKVLILERNNSLVVEYVVEKKSTDLLQNDELDDNVEDNAVEEEVKHEDNSPEEKSSFSLVDSFVICLLVCSAAVSVLELYREKSKCREQVAHGDTGSGPDGESTSNRRISLAELTVNRHLRRRDSQQQLETIRQNSTSGSKPPPLIRRSSFPAQFPETPPPARGRHAPRRQQSTPGIPLARRMSVDLSEDDSSPDRRRVRIIRRH